MLSVSVTYKHVLRIAKRAALRSPAVACVIGLWVMSGLPAAAPAYVQLAPTPVANVPWLDRLNQWRVTTGLPALTENSTWSQGDYNHALYMVKNNLITHYETPGVPYYTSAGDTAARNSNIQVSSTTSATDVQAIDWWMAAPFHAMAMMDPRLSQTGFGSYRDSTTSPWQAGFALDTIRGNSFSGGQYPVYFPGNGVNEPLTSFGGGEWPDPLQACPGYGAPTGLPVFIEVGGNVNTTAGPAHSFTGNGVPLNHCVIDSSNAALNSYLYTRGGVILIPQQPLQTGVKYVVALTVNGVPYTWSFTVGPFFGITGVSPNVGPTFGGTSVTITGTGFSGTTSVRFGGTPASTFSVLNDTTITAVTPAHAGGAVDVTVTAALGTTPVTAADQFTFGCMTASLAPSSGAFPAGGVIPFTAASSGCTSPQYEFWVQYPDGSWNLKQGFGGATFSWNTTGLAPGSYVVHAWASAHGAGHDAIGEALITLTGCTSSSVSPPAVSQDSGSTVSLVASSSGCPNPVYEYWVQYPDGTWNLKRGFAGPAFSWDTTGLVPGTYTVHAWANQQGAAPTLEAYGTSVVTLSSCASASVTPAVVSQPAGSTVALTAGSIGCGSARYEFWVQYPDASWNLKQGWGGAAFSWDTTGLGPGTYLVHAWVNVSGTGYDAIGSATVTLTGCASGSVSPAKMSQAAGTTVALTASSTGCPAPRYEFWVQYPDGTWNLKQGFGGASFNWDTTGLATGTYLVHAWVNSSGTGHDAIGSATVTLTGCASAALSPTATSQPAGTAVSLTASSSGCPTPRYEFWVQYPDGSWNLKQLFGGASFTWDTTGLAPGMYLVHAWVNSTGSSWDAYGSSTVTLTGCASASLMPASVAQAAGSTISVTAGSTGCPNPRYEFWVQYPDMTWHLVQGFGGPALSWGTAGLAKGTYLIHVWVNNQGTGHDVIGEATAVLS